MYKHGVVCLSDLEKLATDTLPRNAWGYYSSGSCAELTKKWNLASYNEFLIRPRVLRSAAPVTLSTSLLGKRVSMPVCIGPVAFQGMAHPSGEIATAGAALNSDTLFCMSTSSTSSMQAVAQANGTGVRWFQVYLFGISREELRERIRLAERHGFSAVVLTVDAPVTGKRYEDDRNAFSLPAHLKLAFPVQGRTTFRGDHGSGLSGAFGAPGAGLDWEFVDWLVSITDLPVILKGICTSADAVLAVKRGVRAVWVSNHGGRHMDRIPGPLELLSEVVGGLAREGMEQQTEVYLDSGIRYGTDVLKAVSLGAKAVFIGQPIIWGLAYCGQEGVCRVLELLREELRLAMALSGCDDINKLPKGLVVNKSEYLNSKL